MLEEQTHTQMRLTLTQHSLGANLHQGQNGFFFITDSKRWAFLCVWLH